MKTTVLIQHQARLLRDGLALLCEGEPDLDVVGAVAGNTELIRANETNRPDAIVLDLEADDGESFRTVANMLRRNRHVRIIGLHSDPDAGVERRAAEARMRSVVAHSKGFGGVLEAIRDHGSTAAVRLALVDTPTPTPPMLLTQRESHVLEEIATGRTTREIAGRLGISPKTVENHKQRIFAKLGVQNQAHAVSIGLRRGLFTLRTASVNAG